MSFTDTPIDAESAARLRENGLRLGLVDTSDTDAFTPWLQAVARGFYGPTTAQRQLDEQLTGLAFARTTAVWDDTAAEPLTPVATVGSWTAPMTVPGGDSLEVWAISAVTVSPTHRRRGIARAMLEAELRTAKSVGVSLAALTVSEATIYSRFGFAPAAFEADITIDTRRARWTGPSASGRLQFLSLEALGREGRELYERSRPQRIGDIALADQLWGELIGTVGDARDESKHLRAVRYDDAAGTPQGFALYKVDEGDSDDASSHTVTVRYLLAATDDAYAGLWHYLLELDLVSTVSAPLRSVDEPVFWQISDYRAARTSRRAEHLWTRILDVKAALEARRYSAVARIVLEVSDPLGFGDGRWLLAVDSDGSGTVTSLDPNTDAGDHAADAVLALSINDLAALYLGGTSASTLHSAGRITERRPGSVDAVDASFRTAVAPWLSTWF